MLTKLLKRGLLVAVMLAATAAPAFAQADTIFVRDLGRNAGSTAAVPFDQTLGINVNQARLDVTNDEVATGASAGQTGAMSKSRALFDSVFVVVKASAGRFYGLTGFVNSNAAVRFFKVFDLGVTPDPSAGDIAAFIFPVPASNAAYTPPLFPAGVAMANGVAIICVTSIADNNESHCTYPENAVTVLYK